MPAPTDTTAPRNEYFSYTTALGWEFPATVSAVMFTGGLVGLIASAKSGGPWPFMILFLCLSCWIAYGHLYHRAFIVRVIDGVLSWSGYRYDGSRPMSDVRRVTLGRGGYVWTFVDAQSMTMTVYGSPGVKRTTDFLDAVSRAYPNIEFPGYPGHR